MPYLIIENLNLKNNLINLKINKGEAIGVFGKNKHLVFDFLKAASGINKSGACFYEDKDVFDNPEYFQLRILLDFSHTYLSTLRVSKIEEVLKNRYNLRFNKDKLIKIGKDLDIRGETEITHQYQFTSAGNTFVNYALTVALEKPNIIIANPTYGLNLKEDIDYVVNGITDTKVFNTAIIALDKLKPFENKLSKILLFTDFDTAYTLDSTIKLIVVPKEIDLDYPLFISQGRLIGLSTFTKEELKYFQRNKISYELISIFDLEDYL